MNLSHKKKDAIFSFFKKVEVSLENFVSKHYIGLMVLIFLFSFSVKFLVIAFSNALGADYGEYLKWADILRGLDVVGKGLRYPPLYPILLNVFLWFLNEITALRVCAAFVYSIIVIPYFLLAKKIFGSSIFPIMASFLIAFNMFYSEMIAWGGNANILASTFLAAFLIFWFNSLMDTKSKKDMLLAAFFASLAVGSHYLLAAYLFMFFLIFLFSILLLWCKNRRNQSFKNLAKTILVIGLTGSILSVPYIFSYTYLLNAYGYLLSPAVFHETSSLLGQFSLGLSVYFLLNIILLVFGIVGVLLSIKDKDKLLGLTLFALFISACLPIFFTLHPDRWINFWPMPVFLGLPVFIRKLSLKLERLRRPVRLASLVGVAILISAYICASAFYLYNRVNYYNVLSPQVLEALKYIKLETEPNSVIATSGPYKEGFLGGGHNYGWWIEGFADRKCVATSYLRFLMYPDEREIAEDANILFSGTDVLLNDFVMVAETFRAGLGNPEIGISLGDSYDKLLFFADNETVITCGSNANKTLSSIKSGVTHDGNGNRGYVNVTYMDGSAFINKHMRIMDGSTVEVSFESVNVTKISIPLFKADFVELNSYHKWDDKNIELKMTTSMGTNVQLSITVNYSGVFTADFRPLENEQKFAMFVSDNSPEGAAIKFRFVLPKLVSSSSNQVKYFDAYNLINQLGINYIMINVNRRREFEWFTHDGHFREVFRNEEIAIFKVETT
jgi:hypothetical protein